MQFIFVVVSKVCWMVLIPLLCYHSFCIFYLVQIFSHVILTFFYCMCMNVLIRLHFDVVNIGWKGQI
jgi:hypothetical protein